MSPKSSQNPYESLGLAIAEARMSGKPASPIKIELRSVHYSSRFSEETAMFRADIYLNGLKAGTAENHGHGGMTIIHPHELQMRLDEYGALLPSETIRAEVLNADQGCDVELAQTAESLIDNALTEYLDRRDLARVLKTRVLFTTDADANIHHTKKFTPSQMASVLGRIEETKRMLKASKLLNTLPFEEALSIYQQHRENGAASDSPKLATNDRPRKKKSYGYFSEVL